MRIAMVVHRFPVISETFVINQITGLLDRGHDVQVITSDLNAEGETHAVVQRYGLLERTHHISDPPDPVLKRLWTAARLFPAAVVRNPSLILGSINVLRHGRMAASSRLFFMARGLVREAPFDVIHCQFGTLGFYGALLKQLYRPRARLAVSFRGRDISTHLQQYGRHAYDGLFRVTDAVLPNCDFFKQRLIALGADASKVTVIRSGIDCERFPFHPPAYHSHEPLRLLTVGRLVEKKGIEYCIRAVASLLNQGISIEYDIIGEGGLRGELSQLIASLGVEQTVHLRGAKPYKDIVAALHKAHLCLATSVKASDGDEDGPVNVLKEAMATGLPVIATRHGGITELVNDGITGYLVPERDVQAIVDKIVLLRNQPESWEAMGRRGRAFVEEHYNIEAYNDLLESTLRGLLAGAP